MKQEERGTTSFGNRNLSGVSKMKQEENKSASFGNRNLSGVSKMKFNENIEKLLSNTEMFKELRSLTCQRTSGSLSIYEVYCK